MIEKNFYSIELFHWAGMKADFSLQEIKNILNNQPNLLNLTNKIGESALIIASANLNLNVMDYLLSLDNIDYKLKSPFGDYFYLLLKQNSESTINYFLSTHLNKINFFYYDSEKEYNTLSFFDLEAKYQHLVDLDIFLKIKEQFYELPSVDKQYFLTHFYKSKIMVEILK